MDGAANSFELILRGAAIGALIATAFGLWRGGKGHSARLAGILFSLSVLAYALQSSAQARAAIGLAVGSLGIAVPLTALTRDREGRQGVLVVVDSRTEFRAVQAGAGDAQRVLIGTGLVQGERVVAKAECVQAGVRVQPQAGASR